MPGVLQLTFSPPLPLTKVGLYSKKNRRTSSSSKAFYQRTSHAQSAKTTWPRFTPLTTLQQSLNILSAPAAQETKFQRPRTPWCTSPSWASFTASGNILNRLENVSRTKCLISLKKDELVIKSLETTRFNPYVHQKVGHILPTIWCNSMRQTFHWLHMSMKMPYFYPNYEDKCSVPPHWCLRHFWNVANYSVNRL